MQRRASWWFDSKSRSPYLRHRSLIYAMFRTRVAPRSAKLTLLGALVTAHSSRGTRFTDMYITPQDGRPRVSRGAHVALRTIE